MAVPCEFGENLTFKLEEQIIIGGSSSRIRKQALHEPTHDLKAMLLDGRRDEISYYQSKEIEAQKPERCAEETNRITATQPALKCQSYRRAPYHGAFIVEN